MCMRMRRLLNVDAVSWLQQRLAAILKSKDEKLRGEIEKLRQDVARTE